MNTPDRDRFSHLLIDSVRRQVMEVLEMEKRQRPMCKATGDALDAYAEALSLRLSRMDPLDT